MLSLLSFFVDPVLRAPTIGCLLMGLGASMVGVVLFLRHQALLGECLSHATYPGVMVGALVVASLFSAEQSEELLTLAILIGALLFSLLGLAAVDLLQRRKGVRSDSALCFVLSAFFGLGITLASRLQFTHTSLYRQAQLYLYGQAATMTDRHILLYALLSLFIVGVLFAFYKEIQISLFDRNYARSLGIRTTFLDLLLFLLVAFSVVIGIRSVGVVLMSAMLVAPAVAARQYTNKFSHMLVIAAVLACLSGFLGNVLAVSGSNLLAQWYPEMHGTLPTGPMIVLTMAFFCLASLLLAPERGWLPRALRVRRFRHRCIQENILKNWWRSHKNEEMRWDEARHLQSLSTLSFLWCWWALRRRGWVKRTSSKTFILTPEGRRRAAKILRLHALWELYLSECLGLGIHLVHRSAEEMEHLLTPELEERLTRDLRSAEHRRLLATPSGEGSGGVL